MISYIRDEVEKIDEKPYKSLIGRLIFSLRHLRLDIMFALNLCTILTSITLEQLKELLDTLKELSIIVSIISR